MHTKLTLTIEQLSDDVELTPIVKALKGSVRVPKNFDYDYKKARSERLTEKYLKE